MAFQNSLAFRVSPGLVVQKPQPAVLGDFLRFGALHVSVQLDRCAGHKALFLRTAFADKSVAAMESLDLDERTFGNIIEEEIDRINAKNGKQ